MTSLVLRLFSKIAHIGYETLAKFCAKRGEIYMLHNVSENKDIQYNITPLQLDSLLSHLKDKNIIPLANWEKSTDFIAFTIDDVPENFYHFGFPIFKKYNIPFTVFVSTSLLDTEGFITTDQLRELAECPLCTVGSHGTSHEYYREMNKEQKRAFLIASKSILSEICGKTVNLFAFPYGSLYACGFRDKHLVSKYYQSGFGTVQNPVTCPLLLKKYFLPRINIDQIWSKQNL